MELYLLGPERRSFGGIPDGMCDLSGLAVWVQCFLVVGASTCVLRERVFLCGIALLRGFHLLSD